MPVSSGGSLGRGKHRLTPGFGRLRYGDDNRIVYQQRQVLALGAIVWALIVTSWQNLQNRSSSEVRRAVRGQALAVSSGGGLGRDKYFIAPGFGRLRYGDDNRVFLTQSIE